MTGNIYISGQIGTFDGVAGVELVDVISQVKKQPKATAFNVHINSEGGLVDVGFDIYHYLQSVGKPLTTIGSGIVASIATVIFMAGTQRLVRENTPFMIHLPWGGSMGTADELSKFASQLKAIEKKLVGFYSKSLSLGEEALLPLLKNETWLTPNQLTALGFTTSRQVKAVAKAFFKTNPTMSGTFSERDRHWMEGLFTKVLGRFKKSLAFNKVLQDATGIEIDFTELADEDIPAVGDMAMIDGKPAEGEYVMPDGGTYIFTAGELTEIIDAEDDADADLLKTENKNLKRQLNSIRNEVMALKRQVSSGFNIDGKKASARRPGTADRTSGMKEYLRSKKGK